MRPVEVLEPSSAEADPFFAQDLRQMAAAHNYRRWQFTMVAPFVAGKVLEIGGGIGSFTPRLSERAESVITIEPNADCYQQLAETTKSLANVTAYNIAAEVLDERLPPDYEADTVVCMNVLEHLKDDEASVRMFTKRLKLGGTLVLLVPGVSWVYGDIDRRLGHYRRYSRRSARALLESAELRVLRLRYFNFIGLWGWLWNISVARRTRQSDLQIHIFDRYIVPWQSHVESILPPPIGQSLVVAARKVNSLERPGR